MNEVNESLLNQWAKPTRLTRALKIWVKVVTREPYEIGKMQQSDSKIEKYALHNDGVIVLLN